LMLKLLLKPVRNHCFSHDNAILLAKQEEVQKEPWGPKRTMA